MTRCFGAFVFIACAAFATAARAQVAAQPIQQLGYSGDDSFDDGMNGAVVMQNGDLQSMQSTSSQPKGPLTPRSTKLKALNFDRRPSTILTVWSTPPKSKEEAKSDASPETKPAEDAKPANDTAPTKDAPPANDAPPTKDASAKPADPEAEKKAAAAEAAKKKAAEEAAKKVAEAKAIDDEMAALQRNVTLGDWDLVKSYFAGLTKDERAVGYDRMLQSLVQGVPPPQNVMPQVRAYIEKNRFAPSDVVAIAGAAPDKLSVENQTRLGQILRQSLDAGHQVETFLGEIRPHLDQPDFPLDRREIAHMLIAANELLSLEEFVPSFENSEKNDDPEGHNLRARFEMARYQKENKTDWLESAWASTQAVLARKDLDDLVKKEALQRAVDLAPKLRAELGATWLDESFTSRPERGMEILATIGTTTSAGITAHAYDEATREKLLELQTTAAKALLKAAPDRANEWSRELGVLAENWLREAQITYQFDTSSALGPQMQRDPYGNFYYWNNNYYQNNGNPKPITTAKMLEMRPSDEWIAHLDSTLKPRFDMVFSQLYLKVGEEAKAFPYIEGLAKSLPKQAKSMVDEFLQVWTKNHNPNSEQQRTNRYSYFYGFEQRASGIPLTRSKQERNLTELGEWLTRLRGLNVELDDQLVAQAFTTAHSSAEVFRLELVEQIFGPMKTLKPSTLAELLETMRTNLVTVWRDAAEQEKKKTQRKQADIEAEIQRGYELANATIDGALADHADSWELWLVKAAIQHDANNYRHTLGKDPEFSSKREEAFGLFKKAADLYATVAPKLDREKQSTQVYELWFYAALGACDLKFIDHEQTLAASQIPMIRDAIAALPAELAERHTAMFANTLFSRMSNAAPAVKFRYVREGLNIVGDHKLARDARQIYDYYNDLVTEIQLRTYIDGSDKVGNGQPFGLRVDIRHTKEIERESGGFSKYLVNQNAANFSFNYGRPTEDYRDKFEEAARATLGEHFEVISVTFNAPEAKSHADAQYGWRVTPYAYILLKARGPQIDRVPPLQLDLDFMDTSGYAVLPIQSAVLPIDAADANGDARPFTKLALTQTLDERQAKDGKLLLDVKAAAVGLVPSFESILEFAPQGFEVAKTDDHGVAVVKFDDSADAIDAERTWTLTLHAKDGAQHLPDSFTFGKPRTDVASSEHFRYVDADLATVAETIPLEHVYGTPSRAWIWWSLGGAVVLAAGFVAWRTTRKEEVVAVGRYRVPETITPFTVLGLLRHIEETNGLAPNEKTELATEIASLERHFFVDERGDEPDLDRIAQRWVERTN